MDKQIEALDKRITKLEEFRENDLEKINENNLKLTEIVLELKNITNKIGELASNWEKALKRTESDKNQEHVNINNRISELEENYKKLDEELDQRTINKDAEMLSKIKWQILVLVLSAIVSGTISLVATKVVS